jgi:hypothetical protein
MELWRPIRGYSGYEVSSLGNVRSIDRCVPRGDQTLRLKGRQLKLILSTNGRYKVHLPSGKQTQVHRLVAMAFCHGYAEGLEVNHKNGDPLDNRVENLEWVTPSYNIKHSYDALGRVRTPLGKFGEDAFASKAVVSISMETGERKRWASAMDAARSGFDNARISECCNGRKPYHKGHHWQFADQQGE